jgi:hypothetical protein
MGNDSSVGLSDGLLKIYAPHLHPNWEEIGDPNSNVYPPLELLHDCGKGVDGMVLFMFDDHQFTRMESSGNLETLSIEHRRWIANFAGQYCYSGAHKAQDKQLNKKFDALLHGLTKAQDALSYIYGYDQTIVHLIDAEFEKCCQNSDIERQFMSPFGGMRDESVHFLSNDCADGITFTVTNTLREFRGLVWQARNNAIKPGRPPAPKARKNAFISNLCYTWKYASGELPGGSHNYNYESGKHIPFVEFVLCISGILKRHAPTINAKDIREAVTDWKAKNSHEAGKRGRKPRKMGRK